MAAVAFVVAAVAVYPAIPCAVKLFAKDVIVGIRLFSTELMLAKLPEVS